MTDELRAKFEATFPHLDFSADKYGNYYSQRTLDHLYGYQAAHASRDAEVEALRNEVVQYRVRLDAASSMLTEIYTLVYPPMQTDIEGKHYRFTSQQANDWLQCLSDRIRAIPRKLDAAMAKESGE